KYLGLLILSGIVPLLLSFYPPLKFWRNARALFFTLMLILLVFGSWDVFAAWRGHWYFDSAGVFRVRLFGLPLEEWLFFIVIPFCCVFTWEALKFIRGKFR
ncbi:MAG: lycopene cyclase domain-containing protein, partial [Candidatus Omnitrophica bacterium]|nr:lycopene cyclase domain-containing protein [Candidatus Omnitrophota bacterium]MDD5724791.1 lycopene cyclase domain-containing protein [Candidatus Omnitrophota bacterium]